MRRKVVAGKGLVGNGGVYLVSLRNMKRMSRAKIRREGRAEPPGEVVRIRVMGGQEVSRVVEPAPDREPGCMVSRARRYRQKEGPR